MGILDKNTRSLLALTAISLICSSCGLSLTNRSFVEEMDRESEGLFVANDDFPVLQGDTGRVHRSREEIYLRTPPTAKGRDRLMEMSALDDELSRLEESQTEKSYQHYLRYRDKLGTNSERIYFLKLPTLRERDEYLYGKGLYSESGHSPQEEEAIRNRDIVLGMTKDAVIRSWGRPTRVDVAGNPAYENERWAFYRDGHVQYIYFESGRVQGWTQ